jgi:AbrB family looped-hinge helix DNA binding protein
MPPWQKNALRVLRASSGDKSNFKMMNSKLKIQNYIQSVSNYLFSQRLNLFTSSCAGVRLIKLDTQDIISYHIRIDQKTGDFMHTTISSKYQVLIPKPVRERLNLKPKQKLTVIEKDNMLILIPQVSLETLRGIAEGSKTDGYREKKDRFL